MEIFAIYINAGLACGTASIAMLHRGLPGYPALDELSISSQSTTALREGITNSPHDNLCY